MSPREPNPERTQISVAGSGEGSTRTNNGRRPPTQSSKRFKAPNVILNGAQRDEGSCQPQNSAAPSYLSPASRSSPSVDKPSASSLIVNSIFRSITSDPGSMKPIILPRTTAHCPASCSETPTSSGDRPLDKDRTTTWTSPVPTAGPGIARSAPPAPVSPAPSQSGRHIPLVRDAGTPGEFDTRCVYRYPAAVRSSRTCTLPLSATVPSAPAMADVLGPHKPSWPASSAAPHPAKSHPRALAAALFSGRAPVDSPGRINRRTPPPRLPSPTRRAPASASSPYKHTLRLPHARATCDSMTRL